MKNKKKSKKTVPEMPATPEAPREPRPVGAPRRFKQDEYDALKVVFLEAEKAEGAVQQTIALAQAAVQSSRQLHQQAVARMKKLMDRHGLPDGHYAHDDAACRLQRME